MVTILINLPEELDKKIAILKIEQGKETKAKTIIDLLSEMLKE